jgi:hypothetical protein
VGRILTLRLAPFERDALDSYGASQRVPAGRVIHTAILYYLQERHAERTTWRKETLGGDERGSAVAVEVDLGEETGRALAKQASAQGVDPEDLARHALLFFLADVDSGRVARELERTLRAD